jgi:ribosome-binding protein aMBF1 (putative translation factor)
MNHQNWEPVVFRKTGSNNKSKKPKKSKNNGIKKSKKDEPKSDIPVYKAIQKGRQLMKLSQKQLAQNMNIPIAFLKSFELGKSVPSNRVLQRMEKHIKVKLTGNRVGDIIEDIEKKN